MPEQTVEQTNKALIWQYLATLSGKIKTDELIDQFVSNPSLKEHIKAADAVIPRYDLIPLEMVAEGDRVMVRALTRGYHEGDLNGIPATNKLLEFEIAALYQIRDGKIIDFWLLPDNLSLMQQIGAVPESVNLRPE